MSSFIAMQCEPPSSVYKNNHQDQGHTFCPYKAKDTIVKEKYKD